jgi:dTMP kinase
MGRFITFEGIEGSGKTTQIRLLFEHLRDGGADVVMTREPGGTLIGEKVRGILLDPSSTGLTPRAELFLYAAARAQHIEDVLLPALNEGSVVLCDRFTDATFAYQGYGREIPHNVVKVVNSLVTMDLVPDLTILLDLPAEVGLTRARERNRANAAAAASRFEDEDLRFHQRVRQGYLELASAERDRVKIVPADCPADRVARMIRDIVKRMPGSP